MRIVAPMRARLLTGMQVKCVRMRSRSSRRCSFWECPQRTETQCAEPNLHLRLCSLHGPRSWLPCILLKLNSIIELAC